MHEIQEGFFIFIRRVKWFGLINFVMGGEFMEEKPERWIFIFTILIHTGDVVIVMAVAYPRFSASPMREKGLDE